MPAYGQGAQPQQSQAASAGLKFSGNEGRPVVYAEPEESVSPPTGEEFLPTGLWVFTGGKRSCTGAAVSAPAHPETSLETSRRLFYSRFKEATLLKMQSWFVLNTGTAVVITVWNRCGVALQTLFGTSGPEAHKNTQ